MPETCRKAKDRGNGNQFQGTEHRHVSARKRQGIHRISDNGVVGLHQRYFEPEQIHDRRPNRNVRGNGGGRVLRAQNLGFDTIVQANYFRRIRGVLRIHKHPKGAKLVQGIF